MESGSLLSPCEKPSSDVCPTSDNYSLCRPYRVDDVLVYEPSPTCDVHSTCTCFQRTSRAITRNTACKIVFQFICFGVSATFLITGLRYKNGCPLEPGIPVFLSVEGAVLALLCVVWTLHGCCDAQADLENSLDSYGILIKIQVMFLVLWTITGSVWIYSEHENANLLDSGDADYCEPLVYWVAFGLVTFTYATVVLSVLVAACVCLCEHINSVYISDM